MPGLPASAQLIPESAQTVLYFAHLTDGGTPKGEQWQATLSFSNPNMISATSAFVTVQFYADDGSPMVLDFGHGLSSSLAFSIPAQGVRTFKSTMASPSVISGWARAEASIPIQGTVLFQQFIGRLWRSTSGYRWPVSITPFQTVRAVFPHTAYR